MAHTRAPLDPKISLWHFLAYYLRFQREQHGLSLTQVGQIIGAARSTVSNIEAGRLKCHEDQAMKLDQKYDTGSLFELLLWYARTAHDPDWFRQFAQYEAESRLIRIYQGQVIPTPLQTPEYARALLATGSTDDVEAAVEARISRQAVVLNRLQPPYIWVLLDESVLECEVGEPCVMKNQLRHLLKLGDLPRISVRIVPRSAGVHPGHDGPFRVISLQSRDVAHVGAQRGGRLIEAPGEVRELGLDYDQIGLKAAPEYTSREMIKAAMEAHL